MSKIKFKWLELPDYHEYINNNIKFYKDLDEAIDKGLPIRRSFTGGVGTGKTDLMTIVANALDRKSEQDFQQQYDERMDMYLSTGDPKHYPKVNKIERISMAEFWDDYFRLICSDFSDKSDAIKKRKNRFRKESVFIDDLGAEVEMNDKAKRLTIEMFQFIYEEYKKNNVKHLMITTNLDASGVVKNYGERIYDRMLEMCVINIFPRRSFRELKSVVEKI